MDSAISSKGIALDIGINIKGVPSLPIYWGRWKRDSL
jgi:hypothetical protein